MAQKIFEMLASFLTFKFLIFSLNFSLLFSMYFCHCWSISTVIDWTHSPSSLSYTVYWLWNICRSSSIAYIYALARLNELFYFIIRSSNRSIWAIRGTHIWILVWIFSLLLNLLYNAMIIMIIIQLFEDDIFWRHAKESDSKGNQHKDLKIERRFPL